MANNINGHLKLCTINGSLDEEDLPVDDRERHIEINISKKGKVKPNTATQSSAHASQISLQQSQSIDAAASTSSKHLASETRFEERLNASSREETLLNQ